MGDIIKLSSPATKEGTTRPPYWEIPILFEDGDLLVIDKPSNLLAVQNYSLVEELNIQGLFNRDIKREATWVAKRENLKELNCLYPLDNDTSGVLIFTKTPKAQEFLKNVLGSEREFRTYHALVHSAPLKDEFTIHAGLLPHPRRPELMKIDVKRGKKSITRFKLIESFSGYSLLECYPVTERYLQIRAHLRYIKCPAVCDLLYHGRPLFLSSLKPKYRPNTKREERPLMGRAALHCSRVEIPHPGSAPAIVVESPLPKDFRVSIKMLKQYGTRRWGRQLSP
ncbi:MAG: RluA family pseudouridine synthase [Limisphaerales bacterium]|jgi:RluA family pseudouridine synthase|nr:pseudouridine synthase [Verrucomicrobiota bacterium]